MPITIYRCAHVPEELNERFEELFEDCDIFLVEHAVKEDFHEVKKAYNRLSFEGCSPTFRSTQPSYQEKLNSLIRNSKKRIEVERSPISFSQLFESYQVLKKAFDEFSRGNLRRACRMFLKYEHMLAQTRIERDRALSNLSIKLQENNPGKMILVGLGVEHLVHYHLKQRGVKVKQVLPYTPYVFNLPSELGRRIEFKLPYTREMVTRSLIACLLGTYFYSTLDLRFSLCEKLAREFAEKMSYEELEPLLNHITKWRIRRRMLEKSM